ncbi:unnamed protein product [Durusdinium trenchii]|uniref:Uncharacterized protein n=1 Tax=Durusdinium trenchii TaxID=1381693 RepID=A0ABP0RP16_9DINO
MDFVGVLTGICQSIVAAIDAMVVLKRRMALYKNRINEISCYVPSFKPASAEIMHGYLVEYEKVVKRLLVQDKAKGKKWAKQAVAFFRSRQNLGRLEELDKDMDRVLQMELYGKVLQVSERNEESYQADLQSDYQSTVDVVEKAYKKDVRQSWVRVKAHAGRTLRDLRNFLKRNDAQQADKMCKELDDGSELADLMNRLLDIVEPSGGALVNSRRASFKTARGAIRGKLGEMDADGRKEELDALYEKWETAQRDRDEKEEAARRAALAAREAEEERKAFEEQKRAEERDAEDRAKLEQIAKREQDALEAERVANAAASEAQELADCLNRDLEELEEEVEDLVDSGATLNLAWENVGGERQQNMIAFRRGDVNFKLVFFTPEPVVKAFVLTRRQVVIKDEISGSQDQVVHFRGTGRATLGVSLAKASANVCGKMVDFHWIMKSLMRCSFSVDVDGANITDLEEVSMQTFEVYKVIYRTNFLTERITADSR